VNIQYHPVIAINELIDEPYATLNTMLFIYRKLCKEMRRLELEVMNKMEQA